MQCCIAYILCIQQSREPFWTPDLWRLGASCARAHHTAFVQHPCTRLSQQSSEWLLQSMHLQWKLRAVQDQEAVQCVHGQPQEERCRSPLLQTGLSKSISVEKTVDLHALGISGRTGAKAAWCKAGLRDGHVHWIQSCPTETHFLYDNSSMLWSSTVWLGGPPHPWTRESRLLDPQK